MPAKVMKCSKCRYYSYSLRRCKLGKINPRTKKDTISAARIMELDYICNYCKWKLKVIEQLTGKDIGDMLLTQK